MFRTVFLSTFAAAVVGANAVNVSSTSSSVTPVVPTSSAPAAGDCTGDDRLFYFALIACLLLGVAFLIAVILSLVIYVTKVKNKMSEAETHLHQVMDAILVNTIPKSIIAEIGLIAVEAQKKKN